MSSHDVTTATATGHPTTRAWRARLRFVLGMAQMGTAVIAVVLLFRLGVTAISLATVVAASSLTSISVMLFGSRRGDRRDDE